MYYWGDDARYDYLSFDAPYTMPKSSPWYGNLPVNARLTSLSSVGANLGVTYRWGKTSDQQATQKNTMTVTVNDELTRLPLQNVEVTIVNGNGKEYKAMTNALGIVNFEKIDNGTYNVNGRLNEIATNQQTVTTSNGKLNVSLLHNDPRFTVQGKAINITTNKPEGDVSVTLKNNSKGSVKMSSSQNSTGQFGFQLDANSDFELVGKKDSYLSNIEKISTKGLNRSQTLYVELELGVQEVQEGKSVVLKQIYYDLNKAEIRKDASSDLEKLATFLQDNPTVKVEVASHTDSRGSDEYNLKLSQERAQAVVDYLNQKGIATSRMIAKGYGETVLINSCGNNVECGEEQHQLNRRTEFKIVK
jgi:outer membrane protein OmpA-like peptidoglycan-associated protein